MNNTKRDTQFAGFAKALFYDLPWGKVNIDMEPDDWDEQCILSIAQRVYDLVEHVIDHAPASVSDMDDWTIPDLIDLPKEAR